jgi:hypothetical protein
LGRRIGHGSEILADAAFVGAEGVPALPDLDVRDVDALLQAACGNEGDVVGELKGPSLRLVGWLARIVRGLDHIGHGQAESSSNPIAGICTMEQW